MRNFPTIPGMDSIDDAFIGPISGQIMADPVYTRLTNPNRLSEHAYDRFAIETWLNPPNANPRNTDPMTNTVIANRGLTPDDGLRRRCHREITQAFIDNQESNLNQIYTGYILPLSIALRDAIGRENVDFTDVQTLATRGASLTIPDPNGFLEEMPYDILFNYYSQNPQSAQAITDIISHAPNGINNTNNDFLYAALTNGHYDLARQLIVKGIDPTLPTSNGAYAHDLLYTALTDGDYDLVQELAATGLDVTRPTSDNEYPLLYAARFCTDETTLRALFNHNNVNLRYYVVESSALSYALAGWEERDDEIDEIDAFDAFDEFEDEATSVPNEAAVRVLLTLGANPNENHDGRTLLEMIEDHGETYDGVRGLLNRAIEQRNQANNRNRLNAHRNQRRDNNPEDTCCSPPCIIL